MRRRSRSRMPLKRAASVCSDEAPSSPESLTAPSPQPPTFEEEPMFSPYPPSPAASPAGFGCPASPDYDTSSFPGFSFPAPSEDRLRCQEAFAKAVREGNLRDLKKVLTQYEPFVQINSFTPDGQTALTQSCLDGNLEMMKLLVSHGAALNLANRDGFLPIHLAYWGGKVDVIRILWSPTCASSCQCLKELRQVVVWIRPFGILKVDLKFECDLYMGPPRLC